MSGIGTAVENGAIRRAIGGMQELLGECKGNASMAHSLADRLLGATPQDPTEDEAPVASCETDELSFLVISVRSEVEELNKQIHRLQEL